MPTPSPRPTPNDEKGAELETKLPFMKGYTVFNAAQIDGLPGPFLCKPLDAVERFFANTKITIQHGGSSAFYSPCPRPRADAGVARRFANRESFYAVLAHETTHATRHERRLNRDLGASVLVIAGYAMEELCAEIGAAFLCADLGITPETRDDHAGLYFKLV